MVKGIVVVMNMTNETIQHICKLFDIPYFKGKERYWEIENTQLFGNDRARKSVDIKYHADERYLHFNNKTSTYLYNLMKKNALKLLLKQSVRNK